MTFTAGSGTQTLDSGGTSFYNENGTPTSFSTSVQIDSGGEGRSTDGGREDLNLKIYARDGTFKGNFRNPDKSHRYAKFTGVIVQLEDGKTLPPGLKQYQSGSRLGLINAYVLDLPDTALAQMATLADVRSAGHRTCGAGAEHANGG